MEKKGLGSTLTTTNTKWWWDEIAQRLKGIGPFYEEFGGDLVIRFADFADTLIAAVGMNLKNQMLAMAACNCYLNKMLQTRNFWWLFIESCGAA